MLPFYLKLCLNLATCFVLRNTNTSKTWQKKNKDLYFCASLCKETQTLSYL